jgi:hypothetical protein
VHRLSGDDTWGLQLDSLSHVGLDGSGAVDGVSEGVHDSAQHAFSDGHVHNGTSSLHDIAFLNFSMEI